MTGPETALETSPEPETTAPPPPAVDNGRVQSEWCPGCPVPHRFWVGDRHGVRITHTVQADGSLVCDLCTASRPCVSTVVAGRGGVRLKGPNGYGTPPKPRHRDWMIR